MNPRMIHLVSWRAASAFVAVLALMTAITTAQASPNVETIIRKSPTSEHTNADTVTWLLTFTEGVRNVDPADFVAIDTTTATLTVTGVDALMAGCHIKYDATLSGGDLDSLNGTVELSVSDDRQDIWGCLGDGEPMTHPGPNSTNDNTFVLDNTKPTLTISGVPQSTSGPFTATFTFSETVSGFDVDDIAVTGGAKGTFTETISGKVWRLAVTPSENYNLSVAADAVTDTANNGNAPMSATGAFTPDRVDPAVASIVRRDPAASPTNADTLKWRVTFSEPVKNVDAADFSAAGATATLAVSAVGSSVSVYDVTASGGDLGNLNATVTLSFASGRNIQDLANNTLTDTTPTGNNQNTFILDNKRPTVTVSGVPSRTSAAFTATFTFSEPVSGFGLGDITTANAAGSSALSGSGTTYRLTVTPLPSLSDGDSFGVSVAAGAARDAAGNTSVASATARGTYDINRAPTVSAQISGQSLTVDGRVSLTVGSNFTDPDGDTLTYSARSHDTEKATATVSGSTVTLTGAAAGTANVTVTATDPDGLSVSDTFTVTVNQPNRTPTVSREIADRAVDVDAETSLDVSSHFADADGDALTYSATSNDTGKAAVTVAGATVTIAGEGAGTADVTVTATDPDGLSVSHTFAVTVKAPDLMPGFGGGVADQRYRQSRPIEPWTLPAATGGDGPLTYSLTPPLPAGLSFDAAARTVSGTPLTVQAATAYTYTATDADGDTASLDLRIEVSVADFSDDASWVILPELARALADRDVGAVSRRMRRAWDGGAPGSRPANGSGTLWNKLAGGAAEVAQGLAGTSETGSLGRLLGGMEFALPLNGAGAGSTGMPIAVWGAGDYRNLSGGGGELNWSGDLASVHLGVDSRFGERALGGVAVSLHRGNADYGGSVGGEFEVDLASVQPYVGWSGGNLDLWATAGFGRGDLNRVDAVSGMELAGELSTRTLGAGVVGELMRSGGFSLSLKGEAMATRFDVEAEGEAFGRAVDASRLRLSVEAEHERVLAGGGVLSPSFELGVRYDGGDGETGAGVELGAGLRHVNPESGLTIEGRARALLGRDELEEWGLQGLILLDRGADGRGLTVRLKPGYGPSQSGMKALWSYGLRGTHSRRGSAKFDGAGLRPMSARLDMALGYGLEAPRGRGLLTPFGETSRYEANAGYRLGLRWEVDKHSGLELNLEREERELMPVSHGVMLTGEIRFR